MRVGTRLAIVSGVVLTAGMTGILVLISNVVFGTATAVVVGTVVASGVLGCGSGSAEPAPARTARQPRVERLLGDPG